MKKIEKIMLGLPNNRWSGEKHWESFPYTLGVLTSVLKDRYEVRTLDADFYNLSKEEVKKQIENYNPDIFGITCMSVENDEDFSKLVSLAKEANPQTKIIVGGIYPTLLPEKIMRDKNIDYAVLGEGEYRLPTLLEDIEKGEGFEKIDGLAYKVNGSLIIQEVKNYIENLDALPFPCYDSLNFFDYAHHQVKKQPSMMTRRFPFAHTITSRGCPYSCIFCSSKAINGKFRVRSAENVLAEVDYLVSKYGIKELLILDDNFYINKKRGVEILKGLIKRKYDLEWKTNDSQAIALDDEYLELIKESGCYQLTMAVEVGSEEQLKLINKPIATMAKARAVVKKAKELGLQTVSPFITGIPGETWEQIRKTGKFAEELDLDYCAFNIATPLPRTKLYEIAKERNLLPPDFSFDNFYGFGSPNITTDEFTPSELLMFRIMEWDRINFKTPEKIKKIAEICGMTIEEVEQWRKDTRRCVNVDFKKYKFDTKSR